MGPIIESYLRGPNLLTGDVRTYKGWNSPWRSDNLMKDVEVVLSGDGKKWSARTDESGHFELRALPAGEYDLNVIASGMSFERPEDAGLFGFGVSPKVALAESGCSEAHFIMHLDQGIRGIVKDADDKPVAGIRVAAYAIEEGRPSRIGVRAALTDREGRYELQRVPNGAYIVGVNADWGEDSSPYRRAYHTASNSQEGATRVTVDGQTRNNIDISLSPPRKLVAVSIRVVFPDGKVAPATLISITRDDNGYIPGDLRDPGARFTDATGVLKTRLYEGDEYLLSAKWTDFEPGLPLRTRASLDSNQVRFAGREGAVVTLVLNVPRSPSGPQN